MHTTFLLGSIPTNSAPQKTSCSRGTQGSFPELKNPEHHTGHSLVLSWMSLILGVTLHTHW